MAKLFTAKNCSTLIIHFLFLHFYINFSADDEAVSNSGLLESEDIVVSRKDNCYVLTAIAKKPQNTKKINGAETLLKRAGAGMSSSWAKV